jgi:hypothetical protein
MPISDVLAILAYFVPMIGLSGLGTYLLIRRDFRGRYTKLVTMSCAILVGATSWLGFVFSFFAFLVAAAVYLVMRRLVRAGPALAVSAVVLVGGLIYSVLAMTAALDHMG